MKVLITGGAGFVGVRLARALRTDVATATAGSAPAFIHAFVQALARAGEAEGLSPDVAMQLARATVCGAGELAHRAPESAAQLRVNVTSPGGTTAAALAASRLRS